jgi:hypothetical protein
MILWTTIGHGGSFVWDWRLASGEQMPRGVNPVKPARNQQYVSKEAWFVALVLRIHLKNLSALGISGLPTVVRHWWMRLVDEFISRNA